MEEKINYKTLYLSDEDLEKRDLLEELGLLKIEYTKPKDFNQETMVEYKEGEPFYHYFSYKESRKNKFKFENWLIGNWHFKLLASQLDINILNLFVEYPSLMERWYIGKAGYSLRAIKSKLKSLVIKDAINEYKKAIKENPEKNSMDIADWIHRYRKLTYEDYNLEC